MDDIVEKLKAEVTLLRNFLTHLKFEEEVLTLGDVANAYTVQMDMKKIRKELNALSKWRKLTLLNNLLPTEDIEGKSLLEQIEMLYEKIALQRKQNLKAKKRSNLGPPSPPTMNLEKIKPPKKHLLLEDEDMIQ